MNALTPEQRKLVEEAGDEPVRLEDPETHEVYVVIREEVFRRLREAGEVMPSDFPLAEEVRTYEAHLPAWVDREGQWVLIKGRDVLGFFAGCEPAMEAGYKLLGIVNFLVKQITQDEPIYNLGGVVL